MNTRYLRDAKKVLFTCEDETALHYLALPRTIWFEKALDGSSADRKFPL
ncbi:MAG: hypothetical protein WCP96_19830 [Methylococcaceae bacterium]